MICNNCKTSIGNTYEFCPYCGNPLNNKISIKQRRIRQSGTGNINNNFGSIYQNNNICSKIKYKSIEEEQKVYSSDKTLKKRKDLSIVVGVISGIVTIVDFFITHFSGNFITLVAFMVFCLCVVSAMEYSELLSKGIIKREFWGDTVYRNQGAYYKRKEYIMGKCPICDGDVYIKKIDIKHKIKQKEYGVCNKHPLDHIFSIEDDYVGIRIEENEKYTLNL